MAMPRGGRPLVIAKRMPAACKALTAFCALSVNTFCSVTSVPSTSASTSEIFPRRAIRSSPAPSVERTPGTAVARDQLAGRRGPAAAGDIVRKIARRIVGPGIEDGLHRLPARFDIVRALEQGRVSNHAIVEERLVTDVGRHLEIRLVGKIHADIAQLYRRPGLFGREFECDSLVGLDAKDHPVRIHPLDTCAAKQRVGGLMEADGDLGRSAAQIFSGA